MLDHIGKIPAYAAQTFKDKEALVFEGQSFTFNDLNVLIEKTAGGLHSLGISQGDVVTLYASNSWEWVVSYFAIARIGAELLNRVPALSECKGFSLPHEDGYNQIKITFSNIDKGMKKALRKKSSLDDF